MSEKMPGANDVDNGREPVIIEGEFEEVQPEQPEDSTEGNSETPPESPEVVAEEAENLSSYLELKRDYKDARRAYESALEKDMENRAAFKKMFGVGRKNLSPETQALYDESLVAEKAYYQSFIETQKDKVEARLNRGKFFEDEKQSVIPALINRHIINPSEARLDIQERELPPKLQSVLNAVKANKYKLGTAAVAAGYGFKVMSVVSSFGVGLAAGAASRWTFKKAKEIDKRRLQKKTQQFNELFASGELDELGDIKNEYFQDLRHIDNAYLMSNLASAGIAVTAGTSFHGSELQADMGDAVSDRIGDFWEAAKEKFSSIIDHAQHEEGWHKETLDAIDEPPSVTPSEAVNEAPPEVSEAPVNQEQAALEQTIEHKHAEAAARQAEILSNNDRAWQLAERMGVEVEGPLEYRTEGGVIVEIEGQPVPESYFSDADKANIEAARMIREGMATGSLDDALDATEEALGETIGEPVTPDTDNVIESPEPETPPETSQLSAEAQEKLDNMRAVQNAQERAQEMMDSESVLEKYEIKQGDTLSEIAEANDVSIKELMEANPEITNPHEIVEGQEINIPEATGSSVYDEGVGLGGPGSEGYEAGVSTETAAEAAGTADETAEAPSAGAEAAATETASETSSDSPEISEAETPTPTETAETDTAEVPDYSGAEASPEATESTSDTPEGAESETPEETPNQETFSNVPREAIVEEIRAQQQEASDFFSGNRHDENPIFKPELLFEQDQVRGYEPLYTPELLERTIEVDSIRGAVSADNQLGMMVSEEVLKAYHAGEIDLPLQWVYLIDIIGDKMPDVGGVVEGSTDWSRGELLELSQQASVDIKELNSLSTAEIQELGISTGTFEDIRPGDEIKVGELIRLMMQNMAERING